MKKALLSILVFTFLATGIVMPVSATTSTDEKIWVQTDFNMPDNTAAEISDGIPGIGISKIINTTGVSEISNGALVYTKGIGTIPNWDSPAKIIFSDKINNARIRAAGFEDVIIEFDLTCTDTTNIQSKFVIGMDPNGSVSASHIDMRYNGNGNTGGLYNCGKDGNVGIASNFLTIKNEGTKRIKIVTDLIPHQNDGVVGTQYFDFDVFADGVKVLDDGTTRGRNVGDLGALFIAGMDCNITSGFVKFEIDNLKVYSRKPNVYLESINVNNNAKNVKVTDTFTVKFENATEGKAIEPSSVASAVSLMLKDETDNTILTAVDFGVTDNGDNSFRITPDYNLLYGREYVLSIDTTQLVASNNLPVLSLLNTNTINFKTKSQYLSVTDVTYSGDKANLSWVNSIISFEFDEELDTSLLELNQNNIIVSPEADFTYSVDGNILDVEFNSLLSGTDYTVTLSGIKDKDSTPMQAEHVETFSTDPSVFEPYSIDSSDKPFKVLPDNGVLKISGTADVFDRYKNEKVSMIIAERGDSNPIEDGIIDQSALLAHTLEMTNKQIDETVKINPSLLADKNLRAYFYALGFEDVYYYDFLYKSESEITSVLNNIASQKTTAGMLGVIEANADYLGVDTTYEGLGNSQIVMKKIIEDAPTTIQGVRDSFENGMVILRAVTKINNAKRVLTNDSNTGFDDVINAVAGDLGISSKELAKYNALSEEDKKQVAAAIVPLSATAYYTSVEELSTDFSTAINSALADNDKPQKTPQGGGNSSGGLPVIGAIVSTQPGISPSSASNFTMKSVVRDMNFNDISNVSWAKNSILALANRGIIDGVSETEFNPDANITREQFIKIVMGAFNFNTSGRPVTYSDVSDDEWYFPYISAATQNGLITGINDKEFGVGMPITRQDMAVILYRVITKLEIIIKNEEEPQFADNDQISDYAKKAVASFSATGLINGVGDNSYNPRGNATRAQAAHLIYSIASYCTGR